MRLYLDEIRRLHIWDSSLKVPNVSEMHTHPWNFRSHVVAGIVQNEKFVYADRVSPERGAMLYNRQRIFCGVGGGLEGEPDKVLLASTGLHTYVERETYREEAYEIHVSRPQDGTVTIVRREFLDDSDHAYVYWYEGDWVSAEPRPATIREIGKVTENALEQWFR